MNEPISLAEKRPILVQPGAAWEARALADAGLPARPCASVADLCQEIAAGAAGAVLGLPALTSGAPALADALLRSALAPNFPIVVSAFGFSLPPAARTLEFLANVVPLDPGTPPAGVVAVFQGLLRASWGVKEEPPVSRDFPEAEFLEAVPAGVLIGDLRGGVSYVNQRFLEMLGLQREEVLSSGVPWDQLTAPESPHRGTLAVRELETEGYSGPYRKTFLTREGHRVPTLVSASVLRKGPGGTALVGVFLVDLRGLESGRGAPTPERAVLRRVPEDPLVAAVPPGEHDGEPGGRCPDRVLSAERRPRHGGVSAKE
jgi:PAS domain S-box-containing protein